MSVVQGDAVGRRPDLSPAVARLGLAAVGMAVWISVSPSSGAADAALAGEARQSELYLGFGLPIMMLAAAVAGFLAPDRAWRWPLWLAVGHQLGMLVVGLGMQSGLSLVILSAALALLLAAFLAVPALLGGKLGRKTARLA